MEITQEQKDALNSYEEIKIAISGLEKQLEQLKEIILPIMSKDAKLEGSQGSFELKERANWKFSPDVKAQEDIVKNLKADEVAKGIATNVPTVYLEYRKAND